MNFIEEFGDTHLPLHSAKILPSLYHPEYIAAVDARRMRERDEVLGLFLHGEARAYPTWIMDNIHMVNDFYGSDPVLVIH